MKCNYKNLATSDLEAMARKREDELRAIRGELARRGALNNGKNDDRHTTD